MTAALCRLALFAAGWMLHALLAPPHRLACLACHNELDMKDVAYDLTGGNRVAAYHCRGCESVMTVHVPTPGGAVTERLPETAGA